MGGSVYTCTQVVVQYVTLKVSAVLARKPNGPHGGKHMEN